MMKFRVVWIGWRRDFPPLLSSYSDKESETAASLPLSLSYSCSRFSGTTGSMVGRARRHTVAINTSPLLVIYDVINVFLKNH